MKVTSAIGPYGVTRFSPNKAKMLPSRFLAFCAVVSPAAVSKPLLTVRFNWVNFRRMNVLLFFFYYCVKSNVIIAINFAK
jgi:hypothetical protein